jgi:ATP-binding cassette subfamily C (CFTR/MRP) protein 1
MFHLQIIRNPLLFFPLVLSSLSDALVALGRISQFLISEDLPEPYLIDKNLNVAVQVDGDFVWETVLATGDGGKGKFLHGDKGKKPLKGEKSLPVTMADLEKENLKDVGKNDQETPFELKNLKISVPKGAFVGIVGRVGSGKV